MRKITITPRVSLRKLYESSYSERYDKSKLNNLLLGDDDELDIESDIEKMNANSDRQFKGFETFIEPILSEIKKYLSDHFVGFSFKVDYVDPQIDGTIKKEYIEIEAEKTSDDPYLLVTDKEITSSNNPENDRKRITLWNMIPQILGDEDHNIFAIVINALGNDAQYLKVVKEE